MNVTRVLLSGLLLVLSWASAVFTGPRIVAADEAPAALKPAALQTPTVTVALPAGLRGAPGDTVVVPILVSTSAQIGAAQFVVNYNDSALTFVDARVGLGAGGFVLSNVNPNLPFPSSTPSTNRNVLVQISGGGVQSFTGDSRVVAALRFRVVGGASRSWVLSFDRGLDRTNVTTTAPATIGGGALTFQDTSIQVGVLTARLALPLQAGGAAGDTVHVPVRVQTLDPSLRIGIAQFTVEYDAGILTFQGAQVGPDAPGFTVTNVNANLPFPASTPGLNRNVLVQVSGGGGNSFSSGHVVTLTFTVALSGTSPLAFDPSGERTNLTTRGLRTLKGSDLAFFAPVLSLLQASLAFGDVAVGKSSALNLSVQNTGSANLSISGLTLTGTDASQFGFTQTTSNVPPGQSAVVAVVAFIPASYGSKSATLSIAHNAAGSPSQVSLSGNALPGSIQVFTTALNFGELEVGKNKVLFLTITNSGAGPLSIGSITSDVSGFTVSDMNFTISPNSSREISITYAPTAEVAQSGKLTVASNDPNRPSIQVALSGAGVVIRPRISISPASLSFDTVLVGQRKTLTLAVSNAGRAALSVREVRVSGPPFSASSDTFRLDPNGRRDVGVTFQPTGAGSFSGTLTVSSSDGSQPRVEIPLSGVGRIPPPEVDVRATDAAGQPLTTGRAPLTVKFTVVNTGGPVTTYEWAFGDGSPPGSTRDTAITYTYTAPGTYTVTLRATGPGGSVTKVKEHLIAVRPTVEADFGASPTSGRAPLTVAFTDSSQGQVASWSWEFGDGDTSSVRNPSHIYRAPGAYTVKLTVRGAGGASQTKERVGLILVQPTADFSAAPVSGVDTLTVVFADSSRGATAWRWEFGDGDTSGVRNPTHVYRRPGVYTVRLGVTGPGGSDVKERQGFILVRQGVRAGFGANPTSGRAPLTVAFRDSSRGEVTAWSWQFGDGDTSSVRNPTHTYTRVDTFSVTLRVSGPTGSDARTVQRLIVVAPNRPPSPPVPLAPADSAVGVSLTPRLLWGRSADPENDPVTYDVFLGTGRVRSTPDTTLIVGPLSESTDYTWRVVASDDRGGKAEGPTFRFRTVGDTLAPAVLSGPVVEGITRTGATALWTTDEASAPRVEYRVRGGAPGFTVSAQGPLGREHRIELTGLSPGTTYEYRVVSRDAAGNTSLFPNPPYPAFVTLTVADTVAPQFVVPLAAPFISDTSAVVTWTTDERSSSEAAFRLETDTTFVSVPPGEAGTQHRVALAGLRPGSAYVVRVRSEDASRNAASASLRIVTAARSVTPARLRIFSVSVEGRTESQAIIAWSTDRPASSVVRYGLTSLLSPSLTQAGEEGVLEHRVTLARLSPGTEYFYRVISGGPGGADSSDVFSFRMRAAARTTPPVILQGPIVQGTGQDRATVLWKTDEVSSSEVEYDTAAVISTRVVTVPGAEKEHAVTLTGLSPGTTYFYRVRSAGLARLSVVSEVLNFTTLTVRDTVAPTILEGPAVTVRTAIGFTVDWVTDEISASEVVYGPPDSLIQSRSVPGLVQRHSVSVSDLRPATRYGFKVRSADAAGNARESGLFDVTTLADTLVDRTSPRLVSPPSVARVTHQEATIGWDTDEPANGLVEFGRTAGDLSEVQGEARTYTTRHSVRLTDLSAATTYHYRISSTDATGNGPTKSAGDLTFTTRAAPDTISAAVTSGPTVASVADRAAVVEWGTDELSDSQVDYAAGSDTTASRLAQQLPEAATAHRITLVNLTPDTTYTFRVSSQDLARNPRTFSAWRTLRTLAAPDTTPPDIVGAPTVLEATANTATLVWTTDELTSAVVEYGTGDFNAGRIEQGALEQTHTVTLTGLLPGTEYRYRITSRDREGNGVTTDPTITIPSPRTRLRSLNLLVRTTRVADTTPPVIVEGPIVQISGGNVVVRWVTDELSNSRVVYATLADYNRPGLESDVFDARLVTVHLVTLAGLDLNTQYLFRCVSADAAGNTVASGGPRSTKPVEGGGLALQPPGGDGSFVTAPQADRQAPVILSGPTVTGSTSSSLTLEWATDEASDSFAEYGPGERTVSRAEDGTPVTRHRIVLAKLTSGTAYTFTVGSADPSRNGPTRSKRAVGSTAAEVDVTPPKILSSPAISYKSDRQAVVTWRTDEPGSSTVEYGPGTETAQVRSVPEAVTEHRVTLTNLTANMAYSFRAGSLDASNNGPTWSSSLTFTTDPAPDTTPPRIVGDPQVSAVTDQTATVTWATDELSDSAVRFGAAAATLDFNVGSAEAVTAHRVTLTNLKPATTYFLRVSSIDRSGNGPVLRPEGGRTVSFITAAVRDTVAPAPVRFLLGQAGSRTAVLNWRANSEADIAGYNVYRGTGDETPRLIASNLTLARFPDEGLTDETTYRYAVTALDRTGNEGPRSEAIALTPSLRNAPTAPVFRGVQGKPLMPTFVVENAKTPKEMALTYTFQVSARQDFADVVASAVGVKEGNESTEQGLTAWTITRELTDGGTYYLRVRANDGAFDGPFMSPYAFRADPKALERPGDFNGDLAVDFEDFFLFAGAFGERATGDLAKFDMVKNGVIDFEDFFAFAGVFGRRYES